MLARLHMVTHAVISARSIFPGFIRFDGSKVDFSMRIISSSAIADRT